MKFHILTIFPKIFDSYFSESILKRAKKNGLIEINVHNLRDFTTDKHHTTDDTPYGGGAGMVMKVEPIFKAVKYVKNVVNDKNVGDVNVASRTILFSAKGKKFTQSDAKRLSEYDKLILICGRYEGVDERVAENIADEEISIGDYVLTGGEIPAMVLVDSVSRLIPGVLGNSESPLNESHNGDGYLEFPQYTKPEIFYPHEGEDSSSWKVPDVLLSGNHKEIEKWRSENSQSKNK